MQYFFLFKSRSDKLRYRWEWFCLFAGHLFHVIRGVLVQLAIIAFCHWVDVNPCIGPATWTWTQSLLWSPAGNFDSNLGNTSVNSLQRPLGLIHNCIMKIPWKASHHKMSFLDMSVQFRTLGTYHMLFIIKWHNLYAPLCLNMFEFIMVNALHCFPCCFQETTCTTS